MAIQQRVHHSGESRSENFPVASWLLPKSARVPIMIFYDFARGADNIADNSSMDLDERMEALNLLKESLDNHYTNSLPPWALAYHKLVQSGGLRAEYGQALLSAFMQDCEKLRYETWDELLDYCQRSAAPVGQAMLELCGEKQADISASDKLCSALQILNHVQDIRDDYENLDRIYVPNSWWNGLKEEDCSSIKMGVDMKQAVIQMLNHTDQLIEQSAALLPTIGSRRLRIEITTIHLIARKLSAKLRQKDVMAQHVSLSKSSYLLCFVKAIFKGWSA